MLQSYFGGVKYMNVECNIEEVNSKSDESVKLQERIGRKLQSAKFCWTAWKRKNR